MIVPKINDWVAYRDRSDGPGKVVAVDKKKEMFTADFLTEPDYENPSVGSPERSGWLSFSEIEYIISEPKKIAELEKEYSNST
ncbi:MAG: hypothetical protein COX31_03460 [Candidatus Moranbacteria bacterium CG23_combo_of_CG06-09_8_20_14_all_40_16]|nr:MAG: hypothetical protein COX31_03460 [Candidatus Moranbacteria bacterium CG23_combo_of_CG06-09_8_20_14_all_40_16]